MHCRFNEAKAERAAREGLSTAGPAPTFTSPGGQVSSGRGSSHPTRCSCCAQRQKKVLKVQHCNPVWLHAKLSIKFITQVAQDVSAPVVN
eukprot:scaffold53240_cov19-Tisochrysis_lutea.AAC.1